MAYPHGSKFALVGLITKIPTLALVFQFPQCRVFEEPVAVCPPFGLSHLFPRSNWRTWLLVFSWPKPLSSYGKRSPEMETVGSRLILRSCDWGKGNV